MEIDFDLTPIIDEIDDKKYIPVQFLVAKGYKKPYIEKLFSELEELGYGAFYRGKRGRANCGVFYPSENCPMTYTLFIDVRSPRKDLFLF